MIRYPTLYLIAITNKGKEFETILQNIANEVEKKVLEGISEKQKEEFISVLDKIFENLNRVE